MTWWRRERRQVGRGVVPGHRKPPGGWEKNPDTRGGDRHIDEDRSVGCTKCGEAHGDKCWGHKQNTDPPKRCMRPQEYGTHVCYRHGASTPSVAAKVERTKAIEIIRSECARVGRPIVADPGETMLAMVHEWAGNAEFYRERVQRLDSLTSMTMFGEAKDIALKLYEEACDRVVTYAGMCVKAGLEERRVRVAETMASTMLRAFAESIASIGLTAEQEMALRSSFADKLRSLRALEPAT